MQSLLVCKAANHETFKINSSSYNSFQAFSLPACVAHSKQNLGYFSFNAGYISRRALISLSKAGGTITPPELACAPTEEKRHHFSTVLHWHLQIRGRISGTWLGQYAQPYRDTPTLQRHDPISQYVFISSLAANNQQQHPKQQPTYRQQVHC